MSVEEQASAPSASAGYGKYYFKTDGNPYALNDAGTEFQLNAGGGGFTSGARVFRSGNQSIPNGVDTKVEFNAETFDTDGEFDSATNNRFTSTNGGIYKIDATVNFSFLSSGNQIAIYIFVNGVQYSRINKFAGGSPNSVSISDVVSLSASDYVEIFVFQGSGASRNVQGASTLSWASFMQIQ